MGWKVTWTVQGKTGMGCPIVPLSQDKKVLVPLSQDKGRSKNPETKGQNHYIIAKNKCQKKSKNVFGFQKLFIIFKNCIFFSILFSFGPMSSIATERTGIQSPILWKDLIILSQPVPWQDFELLSWDNGGFSVPFFFWRKV